MYRHPASNVRSGRVVHGPFPVALRYLLVAAIPAFLVVMLLFGGALQHARVTCAQGQCVLSRFGARDRAFPEESLVDVTVKTYPGATRSPEQHADVLRFADGSETELPKTQPRKADDVAARIREAIPSRSAFDVEVGVPLSFYLMPLGAFLMMLALLRSSLKGRGRFEIEVGSNLRVVRRVVWIPVSTRYVSLDGVTDVEVEEGVVADFWNRQSRLPTGRIVLVGRNGLRRPLSDERFPGHAVHLRAASGLRALLGKAPEPKGVEERLAQLSPTTTPLARRALLASGAVLGGSSFGLLVWIQSQIAQGRHFVPSDSPSMVGTALAAGCALLALALWATRPRII
ncbi:hypothetical protein BH09MYX1_BH09MYX1_55540 [soil metagenome]